MTITVERIDDGEVSPFLTGELRVGDKLELRGPIGGYFVWDVSCRRPAAADRGRVRRLPAHGDASSSRRASERSTGAPAVLGAVAG